LSFSTYLTFHPQEGMQEVFVVELSKQLKLLLKDSFMAA
jgi:hypothetical protein